MANNNKIELPCIPFPEAKTITIPLPFGGELKSLIDMAKPPNDCSLVHSLMLQINPLLASMTCLFHMLNVFKVLKDALEEKPPNVPKLIDDLVGAIGDLKDCFLIFDPCKISEMIAAILQMIISYLNCLIEAIESILEFQLGIDLNSAEGNPVLFESLQCASNNAETSVTNLAAAMEALQPLLDMVNTIMGLVGLPEIEVPPLAAETPSLEDIAAGVDPLEPIKTLRDVLTKAYNALPCK